MALCVQLTGVLKVANACILHASIPTQPPSSPATYTRSQPPPSLSVVLASPSVQHVKLQHLYTACAYSSLQHCVSEAHVLLPAVDNCGPIAYDQAVHLFHACYVGRMQVVYRRH